MIRTQQDEIYAAECEVTITGRNFEKQEDAQRWLDGLRASWWWDRFYWNAPNGIEVYWRPRGSESVGRYDRENDAGILEMLPAHRNELIMLHELSHVLASRLNGSKAHDPFFARTYVTLVYLVLGPAAWLQLEAAFKRHGVDYNAE